MGGRIYIKTFGCQMNEYDSAKMADVLAASARHGRRTTAGRGRRDRCSTPVRCARRPRKKCSPTLACGAPSKRRIPDLMIGVGGCVASQEGAASSGARPYVDLVFGPQTLHRLPEMLEQTRRTRQAAWWMCPSPRSRSSTVCRRRAPTAPPPLSPSWKAAASTARFCVVPYTRGEEVNRPFDDVHRRDRRAGGAGREGSDAAGPERQRLPRPHARRRASPTWRCSSSTSPRWTASSASASPPPIRWSSPSG